MLTVTENTKEKLTFHLAAKNGGAFDPGTVPVWSIDVGVAGLFPSADGLSCVALAGVVGTATLTASVTAGGKILTVTATLTVTQIFADELVLTADAPVAQ